MNIIVVGNIGAGVSSGGGIIDTVIAGDASIVVAGTLGFPTVETGSLDTIARLHPPVEAWSNAGKRIEHVGDAVEGTDALNLETGDARYLANSQRGAEEFAEREVAAETARAEAAEALALKKTSNLSDIQSVATARTNLELGSAALMPSAAFDAFGAAATAEAVVKTFVTSSVATEQARAEAAEAVKASLASPIFTGTPQAPTQTALDDSTKIATTAYADSAVGIEKSRAETAETTKAAASALTTEISRAEVAEALLAPLESPALTGNPTAPTQTALDDSTKLGTTAYTDSAVAVEKSRAETAEATKATSSALTTETGRAESAEALLAPLASPALTGSPTAPTQTSSDNSTKVATTAFVQEVTAALSAGLVVHESVQWASSGSLPANTYSTGVLTATGNGALQIDGFPVNTTERIIVKNEVAPAHNGIYVVTKKGSGSEHYELTRATDMETGAEVPGAYAYVENGTKNAGVGFTVQGAGPYTLGTTAINWTQFSATGSFTAGTALSKSGSTLNVVLGTIANSAAAGNDSRITGAAQVANNLSDLASKATARTNLELGTAATKASSEFDASGTSATETARAEAAEALKAPLASPALTGNPTAPTQTALNNSTRLATTAYADTAVGVEKSRAETAEATKATSSALTTETTRAETAEALALQKASNLSDLASAATARTNLGLGSAATQSSSAFDAAGLSSAETTRAETAEASNAAAITAEKTRAEAAEAGKATTSALTTETSRAETAEAANATAITTEKSRAETAEALKATIVSLTAETTRAETAEALKAPLASPALTGNPTAPTQPALSNSTRLASTAYADSAVAVEKSRAETAEATKATSSALSAETTRALTAEGLLAPLASPTLTGNPTAPTQSTSDNSTKLATTQFVQEIAAAQSSGLVVHTSVQWASSGALPTNTYATGVLTATANGALQVDGFPVNTNDRIVIKNEVEAANNGIYTVTHKGTGSEHYVLTRATDMATGAQVPGAYAYVEKGTKNEGSGFTVSGAGPYTLGATAINWTQFSSTGVITAGTAMSKAGSTLNVVLGTTGETAAAGNDSRIVGAAQTANNLSDLVSVSAARTNLGLGTAALKASSEFDAAGTSATETGRAEAAEALLAPLASPTLTGTPHAPTPTAGDNTTRIATTAFVSGITGGSVIGSQVAGGNLGATHTLALNANVLTLLTGTLTANLVLTVSPIVAGGYATLKFTQDSTGGRTVTVSDGTNSGVVPLPPWPSAPMPDIRIWSEDGTTVQVSS